MQKNPGRNDWVTTARESLEFLEICLDFDQIERKLQYQFGKLVENEIEKKLFQYLSEEKNKIFLLQNRVLDTKDKFPHKLQDKNCQYVRMELRIAKHM